MSADRATDDEFLDEVDTYLIVHSSPPPAGSWPGHLARLVQMVRDRDAKIVALRQAQADDRALQIEHIEILEREKSTAKADERERIRREIDALRALEFQGWFEEGYGAALDFVSRLIPASPTGDST